MLYVNSKTVKYQELLVAVILSKTFYETTDLYVGDKEKITDIYTRDKKLGIEVVQAEYHSDFLLESYSKLLANKSSTPPPSKANVSSKAKVLSWSYETDVDNEIVIQQFRERVKDKLNKLNHGNYAKIKNEVNLALLSYLRVKDEGDAKAFVNVYKENVKDVEKSFNKIFLIFSTGIYYLMDDNIVAYKEFVGDEFLNYQTIAKQLLSKTKDQNIEE